jgi:hypothetical protein
MGIIKTGFFKTLQAKQFANMMPGKLVTADHCAALSYVPPHRKIYSNDNGNF